MWAEFIVGSCPSSLGFAPGSLGFPPFTKTNISKFDLESVDKKPLCGDATAKFQYILFILLNTPRSEVRILT